MSLVEEIQSDILDPSIPLSSIMRKAKVLAHGLRSTDLEQWVERELNGYFSEPDTLPDYRKAGAHSYGNFFGPFGSGLQNAPIPTLNLPTEIQDFASTLQFREGIRELESLVESGSELLREPWPANSTAVVSKEIYKHLVLAQAWKVVPKGALEHILDTVRNRLLSFVLELEKLSPEGYAAPSTQQPISKEQVSQVFNTFILGNQNIVGAGASVIQTVEHTIVKGDRRSLAEALREMGIVAPDIRELEEALDSDGDRTPDKGLGPKVGNWLSNIVQKTVSQAWDVGITTVISRVADAISTYYGWK